MPISIQCAQCQRQYNVDDRLAGKLVKCKNCGAPIAVPVSVMAPDSTGLPDLSGLLAAEPAPIPAVQTCPSCGGVVAAGSKICMACGLNLMTGKRSTETEIKLADEEDHASKRKKRYVRKLGNPLLEQIDELIKLVLMLIVVTAVIVWIVQIVRSQPGISAGMLGPVALLLALIAGIMAPLTSVGVNIVVGKLNYVPRQDTYVRVVFVLLLPLAVSMMFGWPLMIGRFDGFITLSWLLAPALLIYLLRAETVEWVASVVTAAVAIGIASLIMVFACNGIESMSGKMYADAMPGDPWISFASGHSPVTAANTTSPAVATPASPGQKLPLPAHSGTPSSPPRQSSNPALAAGPTPDNPPAKSMFDDQPPVPATPPGGNPTDDHAQPHPAVVPPPIVPPKISSPMFADVSADQAGLSNVSDIVAPLSPRSNYMLVLKNDDTTTTVERWSVNPLEKKGEISVPYFAKQPSTFALSPNGDLLATLVLFPRPQLEITSFESKNAKKVVQITEVVAQRTAVPMLLGFLDEGRIGILWNDASFSGVQTISAVSGMSIRLLETEVPLVHNPDMTAVSNDGRLLAAMSIDRRINVFDLNQPPVPNRGHGGSHMVAMSNPIQAVPPPPQRFRPVKICFSPDGKQVALYALMDDISTVLGFKTNGEPTYSCVLSGKPRSLALSEDPSVPVPGRTSGTCTHELAWLQDGRFWLANGTELVDVTSGKRIANFDFDVTDQQLVGPDCIALLTGEKDTKRVTIAKLDEDRLKAAAN